MTNYEWANILRDRAARRWADRIALTIWTAAVLVAGITIGWAWSAGR